MKNQKRMTLLTLLAASTALAIQAEDLSRGFAHPPASARPWVYWFPLDGNISSNGITADLEAMQRVGIGGVLYMETDQGAPRGPAKFGGPLWRDLFKHICGEAQRLGLEVNMNNDAGWCGSGGPWIPPELSMQRVVWTETNLAGPRHFEAALAQPETVKDFYRDIAVFAYPTPASNYVIPQLAGKSARFKTEIPLQSSYSTLPAEAVTARETIVELTSKLGRDGRLLWDVPAGNWTVLRLGHTTTGKDNHPAPIDGRGLECDKLSKTASKAMFDGLMGKLVADNSKLVGEKRTLVSTHIDSWEVGSQNWTPKFREEFERLRGYDLRPFLPVMAGRVVDSLEISERFLWDVRMTINELLLENYAGHFHTLARRHGMRLSIEAYDGVPADDMAYAGRADEPMGEFWSYAAYSGAHWCTEMASAAHVYGKSILGAEAFTATDAEKWQAHPGSIKAMGDWAFCAGINRFVFHRYALQPWTNPDRAPGMSMGPWGLHYERTQTWWEQSRAWHEYLARCQFMLQQGRFAADLCFLAPETSPQAFKSPIKSGLDRPGYNFDGCPAEVLLTRMSVKQERLVLPDGMSYRLLVLPQVPAMTPRLLRKIKDLVAAGATVVGAPPIKSPSLSGYPACDQEVKALAQELWGTGMAPAELTERPYGKGRLFWGGEFKPQTGTEIAPANPLGIAKWIWHRSASPAQSAPPGVRFFRRIVELESGTEVVSARFAVTADNSFECHINGSPAGQGDNWGRTYDLDVKRLLKPGRNLLALTAVNGTDSPNPAGLVGNLKIQFRDGKTLEVPTDARWEVSTKAPAQWTTDPAAAGLWEPVMELGVLGMAPWGDVQTVSTASDPIPDVNILCRLLGRLGVAPDFDFQARQDLQGLRYIHRTVGDTEVYFVANKNPHPEQALCSFRVSGRRPEFWWPDSGRMERPATYEDTGSVTRVPLHLEQSGSVFVVFRKNAKTEAQRIVGASRNGQPVLRTDGPELTVATDQSGAGLGLALTRDTKGKLEAIVSDPGKYRLQTAQGRTVEFQVETLPAPLTLDGPWDLRFAPNRGAPAQVRFESLISWSAHSEPGVRYFSGTGTYAKSFNLPSSSADARLYLDLGKVAVMAEVRLNGKDLGILWKAPFVVDITDAAQPGDNQLEVKVVNLWINRQIGDEQLPEDSERNPNGTLQSWPQWVASSQPSPSGRYSFTSWRLWKKDSPLQESGLLGPVTIRTARRVAGF